jgi:hypothetical protein
MMFAYLCLVAAAVNAYFVMDLGYGPDTYVNALGAAFAGIFGIILLIKD